MYVYTCMYMYIYTYMYIHIYIHIQIHVCIYSCVHRHMMCIDATSALKSSLTFWDNWAKLPGL